MRSLIRNQWAGLLALFLVVTGAGAYAAFDPVGPDGDVDACVAKKTGDLVVMKKKRCAKGQKAISWAVAGPRGPQGEAGQTGERGPTGPQGITGPAGSPAASMLFGWIKPADMPGVQRDYTPLGDGAASVGSHIAAPNSPTVLRDLSVRVISAPDFGQRWDITLQGDSASEQLTCSISGPFGTNCNSGSQTADLAAGGSFRLIVANINGTTPTNLYYGYRAVTP